MRAGGLEVHPSVKEYQAMNAILRWKSRNAYPTAILLGVLLGLWICPAAADPPASSYEGNRAPLQAKPYSELPLGAVVARGWLDEQLRRMAAGMTGHLDEWYPEALGPRNAWLGGDGDAWERGPYWIDGLYPLAVLLNDARLKAKAMAWIEWTLRNQRADGYLGPRPTAKPPKPEPGLQRDRQADWWPKMVMLKILQQHAAATGDPRTIDCLRRYFRYQLQELPNNPLDRWSYWGRQRGADNLLVVLWLYNRTGEAWLLDLARLIVKQTLPFTDIFAEGSFIHHQRGLGGASQSEDSFHCVNLAQGMKTPLVTFQLDGDPRHMDATRRALRDIETSHGQPHGLYGADEGMHGRDLDRGSELCTAVEMMFSLEKMLEVTGDVDFADRLEQIAYNPLPTQVTDDFCTRQYYQQANQVQVTFGLRSFHNHHFGDGLVYGVCTGFQCCTCNLHQGWPKLVANLWMASADQGLAALVYGPCSVTARVAGGHAVTIVEDTGYPFEETVTFRVQCAQATKFPLHLRVPGWCAAATVQINAEPAQKFAAGQIAKLDRAWAPGDRVTLTLPMTLRKSYWFERSVAIERGPLVYALRIEEAWSRVRPEDREFGYRECRPKNAWNYALLESDLKNLAKGFEVVKTGARPGYPWTLADAPIELRARGVRVPQWTLYDGSAGRVPMSPMPRVEEMRIEPIRLIPYGCTTLRVSAFPWMQDRGGRVRPPENQ
jgi:hypothetical protein